MCRLGALEEEKELSKGDDLRRLVCGCQMMQLDLQIVGYWWQYKVAPM